MRNLKELFHSSTVSGIDESLVIWGEAEFLLKIVYIQRGHEKTEQYLKAHSTIGNTGQGTPGLPEQPHLPGQHCP